MVNQKRVTRLNELEQHAGAVVYWMSLDRNRDDPREYVYSLEKFERAETHDALWNAAQKEMAITGKMHGYMRM